VTQRQKHLEDETTGWGKYLKWHGDEKLTGPLPSMYVCATYGNDTRHVRQ